MSHHIAKLEKPWPLGATFGLIAVVMEMGTYSVHSAVTAVPHSLSGTDHRTGQEYEANPTRNRSHMQYTFD